MRDIKFRCWDKFEKRMYKVEEIRWNCFKEIELISVYENDSLCKSYVKNHNVERHDIKVLELMQYTGLKDKNGKEIYEGDVIKRITWAIVEDDDANQTKQFIEEISIVEYNNFDLFYRAGGFYYKFIESNEIEKPEVFEEFNIEVIGNIYDHPGLLEKGEQTNE